MSIFWKRSVYSKKMLTFFLTFSSYLSVIQQIEKVQYLYIRDTALSPAKLHKGSGFAV